MGFGGSWSDIPLFQLCDEAHAVANASEERKALANSVILSNADDGVAQYMKEWWENHEKNPVGQSLCPEHSLQTEKL